MIDIARDPVGIDLEAYENRQKAIFENKVKHGFNVTDPYKEVRYMMEEVAELMRAIENGDKQNISEELADIVIFAYGLAEVTQSGDLDKTIFEKMEKNRNRVYTVNKDGDFVKIKA